MSGSIHRVSTSEMDNIESKPELTHTKSTGAITISPELFEKVLLLPASKSHHLPCLMLHGDCLTPDPSDPFCCSST